MAKKSGVTAAVFRRLALSFPDTEERSHMKHPDFRVAGKVFATLAYPDKSWGMVKLTPEQQREFVHDFPKVFKPCNGAWGLQGCTNVKLGETDQETLKTALTAAWENNKCKGK